MYVYVYLQHDFQGDYNLFLTFLNVFMKCGNIIQNNILGKKLIFSSQNQFSFGLKTRFGEL